MLTKLLIESECPICGAKRNFRISTISLGNSMAYLRIECEACSHPKEFTMTMVDWWKFCTEHGTLDATEVINVGKN